MIFLHSSFRTSSTWFWTKFREHENLLCYYEIYNKRLATIPLEEALSSSYKDWNSRHPATDPYFQEFAPLITENGGVLGLTEAMSYDQLVPEGGPEADIPEDEKTYLSNLIQYAQQTGKYPVLSDTRSLGRVAGIKRAFQGIHILIYRNLFHQWSSYIDLYIKGNSAFLESVILSIKGNTNDPFISELDQAFQLVEDEFNNTNIFISFIIFHLYLYGHCASHIDIMVDVNRLALEPDYRNIIENEIVSKCGIKVDLADAQLNVGANYVLLGDRKEVESLLEPWVAKIVAGVDTEVGRYLVIKAYMDFLEEYEKYVFYAGSLLKAWRPITAAWETGKTLRDHEIHRIGEECERMKNSLSWRITAPLRSLSSLFSAK